MRHRALRRVAFVPCLAVLALATLVASSRPASADAWTEATFTGPTGKAAHGFATAAVDSPAARLLIGCESGADAWRGIALLERDPLPAPTAPEGGFESEVVTGFFGRAPVTARWRSKATADGLLSWPASSEELRRGLMREEQTRGRASLQVEIRRGDAARRLVFGLDGLAAHTTDLTARCDGWSAGGSGKPRERGW